MDVMKLQNVWYRYPESPFALEDISLAIAKGERVSLVGPNGAGKSTLLHLMAGLYYPTKGRLEVDGTLLTKKEAKSVRQKVGFLFQDPDDQIFMPTVWEDVAFGPINMGLTEADVKDRVAKAMTLSGIADFKDRVPHRLSIGEKKRVVSKGRKAAVRICAINHGRRVSEFVFVPVGRFSRSYPLWIEESEERLCSNVYR